MEVASSHHDGDSLVLRSLGRVRPRPSSACVLRCRVPGTKEVPPQRLPGVKPGKMSSEQWELGSLSYSLLHFRLRSGIDYIPNMNQHQDYHDGVSQKTGRWLTYLDGWRV